MVLRFLFLGKFELNQLLSLLLFPAGILILLLIHTWQMKRDSNYIPNHPEDTWNTHIGERYSSGKKILYKGNVKQGEYHRFYRHWWQHAFNEVVEGDGKWFMNLSFYLQNGDHFTFADQKKKIFRSNGTWHIYQNDQMIGKVKTDYSLKNSAKLQEGLFLELEDSTYYYKSISMDSKTEVLLNNRVIARGKRSALLKSQYHFEAVESFKGIEALLMMTFILFNYIHHK